MVYLRPTKFFEAFGRDIHQKHHGTEDGGGEHRVQMCWAYVQWGMHPRHSF